MTTQVLKRTRIAPTPSGLLHVGNVLSFAITAALARNSGAKVLLRIDDLDRTRANKLFIQDIFDTLNFLEIPWDEGPRDVADFEENHSQLHRMHLYREALTKLADEKLVFACACSRRLVRAGEGCACAGLNIPLNAENTSWRLVTADQDIVTVKNYNDRMTSAHLPREMHNFVVKKKDGFPAYQLTSVIDDLFYGVDLIIRGEDLWPSTQAQHQLAAALKKDAFNDISFYHHLLLTESSGQKLSKSAGSTSIKYLRESRKTPAQIYDLIGSMLGQTEPARSWEDVAQIVIRDA